MADCHAHCIFCVLGPELGNTRFKYGLSYLSDTLDSVVCNARVHYILFRQGYKINVYWDGFLISKFSIRILRKWGVTQTK